ncbi:MAG: cellulase family glycosylhydrolase [Defluviitaleaceae bacterium]|nr:cellulase family glycosylhydrolase [Defluviitaleaceae bacterium]
MSKRFKKFLSLTLTFAMVLGMFPMMAFTHDYANNGYDYTYANDGGDVAIAPVSAPESWAVLPNALNAGDSIYFYFPTKTDGAPDIYIPFASIFAGTNFTVAGLISDGAVTLRVHGPANANGRIQLEGGVWGDDSFFQGSGTTWPGDLVPQAAHHTMRVTSFWGTWRVTQLEFLNATGDAILTVNHGVPTPPVDCCPNFPDCDCNFSYVHGFLARMGTGWNLGNTFDAWFGSVGQFAHTSTTAGLVGWETGWLGGAANITTQSLIREVSAQGFNTIRIPVSWHMVADPNNNWQINPVAMARVRQVVQWAYDEDLFIILNTHHENRVLFLGNLDPGRPGSATHAGSPTITVPTSDPSHPGNIFIRQIWTQIANEFNDFGERLIFAGMNEPRDENVTGEWNGGTVNVRNNVNSLNQVFVDTVRATGGNNTDRFLQVPTVAAGSNENSLNGFRVPLDLPQHRITMAPGATNVGYGNTNISSSRLLFSIHTYSPFAWAHDGTGTYASPGAGLNALRADLNRVENRANQLGLGVLKGEWGSIHGSMGAGANQALRNTQRPIHSGDYIRESSERGMVAVWWDNGGWGNGDHSFGLIPRQPPHIPADPARAEVSQAVINAVTGSVAPARFGVTINGSHDPDSGQGRFAVGDTITIRAGERDGFEFAGWTVNIGGVNLANPNSATTTFTMPGSPVELTATWRPAGAELWSLATDAYIQGLSAGDTTNLAGTPYINADNLSAVIAARAAARADGANFLRLTNRAAAGNAVTLPHNTHRFESGDVITVDARFSTALVDAFQSYWDNRMPREQGFWTGFQMIVDNGNDNTVAIAEMALINIGQWGPGASDLWGADDWNEFRQNPEFTLEAVLVEPMHVYEWCDVEEDDIFVGIAYPIEILNSGTNSSISISVAGVVLPTQIHDMYIENITVSGAPRAATGCDDCNTCGCMDCFPPNGNCGTCAACALLPLGAGTEADPWQISTIEHLAWVRDNHALADIPGFPNAPTRGARHFSLVNNIDATSAGNSVMIGTIAMPFAGIFCGANPDGGNFNIHLNINAPNMDDVGLFRDMLGLNGRVQNLDLSGSVTGRRFVGGLSGAMRAFTVDNVHSSVVVTGASEVGGLVGAVQNVTLWQSDPEVTHFSTLRNSSASGDVTATTSSAGGLVASNSGIIETSSASGNVSGTDIVGGLVAWSNGSIENSFASGDVAGNNNVGGLVGHMIVAVDLTPSTSNSYAVGAVSGSSNVGGLVGNLQGGSISNSAALSPSVNGTGTSIGSVTGATIGTISNNIAFDGMEGNFTPNGEPISASEISADGSLDNRFIDPPWTLQNGHLPRLRGPALPLPLHLVPYGNGTDVLLMSLVRLPDPPSNNIPADEGGLAGVNNRFNATGGYFQSISHLTGWHNNQQRAIGPNNATNEMTPIGFRHQSTAGIGLDGWRSHDPGASAGHVDLGVAMENASAWQIRFSTEGFENIRFNAQQKSTGGGPNRFALAYRIGSTGSWQIIPDSDVMPLRMSNNYSHVFTGYPGPGVVSPEQVAQSHTFVDFQLPATVADQPVVYLRVFGYRFGIINTDVGNPPDAVSHRTNGNTSINNIRIYGDESVPSACDDCNECGCIDCFPPNGDCGDCPICTPPILGSGTYADPWQISTIEHLAWMRDNHALASIPGLPNAPARAERHFRVVNNIDATSMGNDVIIGTAGWHFMGNFCGGDYTIDVNVYVTGTDDAGLFGVIYYGTVQNLNVSGSVTGSFVVGGLAAGLHGGRVENVHSSALVTGRDQVDGMPSSQVGGLIGVVQGGATVYNSSASREVESVIGLVGGLVGSLLEDSTISRSFATGDVSAIGDSLGAGGLVGTSHGTVVNTFASGNVTGDMMVGGLIGLQGSDGSISGSYATGSVSGAGPVAVGGLVGVASGSIENSAALNPSVTGGFIAVGRVAGEDVGATFTNNIAYAGMTGGGMFGFDGENGADFTALQISEGYTLGGRFMSPPWIVAPGHLPILRGVHDAIAPTITSANNATLARGGTFQVTATGTPTITFSLVGAPTGVSINSATGLITVADTVALGTHLFTITASGVLPDATQLFTLHVTPPGNGTAGNPWQIFTRDDLEWVAAGTSARLSGHFLVMNDIDARADGGGVNNSVMIGNVNNPFMGTFDGDNHTITLNIDTYEYDVGLFGEVSGPNAAVQNVNVSGNVTGVGFVGSLVGALTDGAVVENSHSSANVTAELYAGGLVGILLDAAVRNSSASGNVEVLGNGAGGLLAWVDDDSIVENSFATGNVTGAGNMVGGLVGISSGVIVNTFATGNVISPNSMGVGGLVGYSQVGGEVRNSYATGLVMGDNYVGGLVGLSDGLISDSSALNPSVTGVGENIGRVAGSGAVMSNNIAFAGMTGDFTEDPTEHYGLTHRNGYAISAQEISGDGTLGGRFLTPPWIVEDGYLPVLRGEPMPLPPHLVFTAVAPTITSGNSHSVVHGTGGTFQVTATGTQPITFALGGTVPAGVTINETTGLITIAETTAVGVHTFTITATGVAGTTAATQTFTLTITQAPVAPTITSENSATFTYGTVGTFQVTATGDDPITFALGGTVPAGVTINETTGLITIAATTAVDVHTFTITATNDEGTSLPQNFTLTITQDDIPPTITSANSHSVVFNTVGTFQVTADGTDPITFALSGAPTGISINPTGLISVTPGVPVLRDDASGDVLPHEFTITATGVAGTTPATQAFTLTITPATPSTLTWPTAAGITEGQTLADAVLTGGSTDYGTFAWVNPSYAPSVPGGSFPVEFTPTNLNFDWSGVTTTQNVAVAVTPTGVDAPVITSAGTTTVTHGTGGTFQVTATNTPTAFALGGTVPTGVSINPETGLIAILATTSVGTHEFTITATNSGGTSPTQNFTLVVGAAPPADVTVTVAVSDKVFDGAPVSATASADGVAASDITFTWYDAAQTALVGAPINVGSYFVRASVDTDTHVGQSEFAAFAITPASVIVTADDATMHLCEAVPMLTASFTGFVAPDTAETALSSQPILMVSLLLPPTVGTFDIYFGTYAVLNDTVGANYVIIGHVQGELTVTLCDDLNCVTCGEPCDTLERAAARVSAVLARMADPYDDMNAGEAGTVVFWTLVENAATNNGFYNVLVDRSGVRTRLTSNQINVNWATGEVSLDGLFIEITGNVTLSLGPDTLSVPVGQLRL